MYFAKCCYYIMQIFAWKQKINIRTQTVFQSYTTWKKLLHFHSVRRDFFVLLFFIVGQAQLSPLSPAPTLPHLNVSEFFQKPLFWLQQTNDNVSHAKAIALGLATVLSVKPPSVGAATAECVILATWALEQPGFYHHSFFSDSSRDRILGIYSRKIYF